MVANVHQIHARVLSRYPSEATAVEVPSSELPALVGHLRNDYALRDGRWSQEVLVLIWISSHSGVPSSFVYEAEQKRVPLELSALTALCFESINVEEPIVRHLHKAVSFLDLEDLLISCAFHHDLRAKVGS